MVDVSKKTDYSLNHIYTMEVANLEFAIGTGGGINREHILLYSRSIAIANDLNRIPVMRNVKFVFHADGSFPNVMGNSTVIAAVIEANLYDEKERDEGDDQDLDLLIAKGVAVASQDSADGTFFFTQEGTFQMQGGYLLNNEITLELDIELNQNVATNAFLADTFFARVFIEVDWIPMSKKEMTDYMLEFAFANKDE